MVELHTFGRLLGDRTRAGILTLLLDGRALTGTELARHLQVAPSTVSEHLGTLLDGGLVRVEAQGRHRYWRLAGPDVAELLETMGAAAPDVAPVPTRAPHALAVARSCYDHLAGSLGVAIYCSLEADGHLVDEGDRTSITPSGDERLAGLGVDVDALRAGRRPVARSCLDWTERSPHLAGAAGAALFDALLRRRWVRKAAQPRAVTVTDAGRRELEREFGWRT